MSEIPAVEILPQPDEMSEPFWTALQHNMLKAQRCLDCRKVRFPPGRFCLFCLSEDSEWIQLSGTGKVYTYIIITRTFLSEWRDRTPYNVIQVVPDEMDEADVRVQNNRATNVIYGNLVGGNSEVLRVGLRVAAVFDKVADDTTLLRWRPVQE